MGTACSNPGTVHSSESVSSFIESLYMWPSCSWRRTYPLSLQPSRGLLDMVFSCNWCKAFPSSAPLKFCYPLAVESMGLDRVYHFSEPSIIDDSKSSLVLQQPLKPTPIMPVSCTVTKSSISCYQFSVRIHAVRTTSLLYNCR